MVTNFKKDFLIKVLSSFCTSPYTSCTKKIIKTLIIYICGINYDTQNPYLFISPWTSFLVYYLFSDTFSTKLKLSPLDNVMSFIIQIYVRSYWSFIKLSCVWAQPTKEGGHSYCNLFLLHLSFRLERSETTWKNTCFHPKNAKRKTL